MKFPYSYKVYDGSREAIEISKSRAEKRIFLSQVYGWGIIFAIIALVAGFKSTWYIAIPVIIACIGGFYYLVNHYDDVTDRKVACAILKRELGNLDRSTKRKLIKEFKRKLKEKAQNDVPYDKMI